MKHTGTQPFETKRLLCRRFQAADRDDMFRNWAADPEIQLEYGEPVYDTLDKVSELLANIISSYNREDVYRWAIIEKESGANIGQIALCRVYSDKAAAEIEYCIGDNYSGHGYAGEALAGLIDHVFTTTGFLTLEAYHRAENTRSGRVLEKSGMHRTDTIERFRESGEDPVGEVCYSISK